MAKRKDARLEDWITATEAGVLLGITSRHVRRLIESGDLEGRKVTDRLWLVNRLSLVDWTPKRKRKDKPIE